MPDFKHYNRIWLPCEQSYAFETRATIIDHFKIKLNCLFPIQRISGCIFVSKALDVCFPLYQKPTNKNTHTNSVSSSFFILMRRRLYKWEEWNVSLDNLVGLCFFFFSSSSSSACFSHHFEQSSLFACKPNTIFTWARVLVREKMKIIYQRIERASI